MTLEIEGLTHRYGADRAVDDVSFRLNSGELGALLGPSGCGKTTIVQAVAGHIRPTTGRVALRGEDVTDTPPESRRVGIVFQRSTLYPHMTVGENVAYGLATREIEDDRRDEVVQKYLDLVGLHGRRDAYPTELSGGQRRRVELARALAPQPDILVLDEPLSALDRSLRQRLRDEIVRIQRETGVTTLFVTHDQEEAMTLADRLIVMTDGRLSSVGQPRTLYQFPPNPFVASFLGRSNTLSATIVDQHPLTVTIGEQEITLNGQAIDLPEGTTVSCHIRPEDVLLRSPNTDGTAPSFLGEVVHVADIGRRYDVTIQLTFGDELVVEQSANPPAVGETLSVGLPRNRITLFST